MAWSIGEVLAQWEDAGIFDYVLPFLLIFAIIFGILTAIQIFGKNKPVHVIISVVIAMLSIRLPFVQEFFKQIFPRLGVALAVIIVLVILVGLFIPDSHKGGWAIALYSIGGIAGLLVVFNSFNALDFFGSNWWEDWGSWIIGSLLIIGVIIAIAVSGGEKKDKPSQPVVLTEWRK